MSIRRAALGGLAGVCAFVTTTPTLAQAPTNLEVKAIHYTLLSREWRPLAAADANPAPVSTDACPSAGNIDALQDLCFRTLILRGALYITYQVPTRPPSDIRLRTRQFHPDPTRVADNGEFGNGINFRNASSGANVFCTDSGDVRTCHVIVGNFDTQTNGLTTHTYYRLAVDDNAGDAYDFPANDLGGSNNPIVLPAVPFGQTISSTAPTGISATHGIQNGVPGVNLSWTKFAQATGTSIGRHSSFDIFYKTSAGVGTSDNFLRVTEFNGVGANCETTGANNNAMHDRECEYFIPYSQLSGITDAGSDVYFKVRGRINERILDISNEAVAHSDALAPLTLLLGNSETRQASPAPEGRTFMYSAMSDDESIATVIPKTGTATNTTGEITVNAEALGETEITITIDGGGSGTPITQKFAVRVIPAAPSAEELAKTVLPQIVGAIQNTIADNIGARIRNVRTGDSQFQLGGVRDWVADGNWEKLLDNASFAFSLGDGNSGLRGFWGVGNSQTLDGESNGVKWDGSLSGFSLGADTVLANGNLLGLAFNKQSGEFDVTKNAATSKYDLNMSTFSPYFGGKFRGLDYHASANLGSGEFGDLDLSSTGIALGGERLFRENRFGEQHFKGDFLYSSGSVGNASFSSGRLRAILEQQKQQNANLRFSGEIGGRLDFGNSSGFGVEAVGGLRHSKGKVAIDGQVRTLLFHSESVGEFGLQVRIQVTPGNDGQGLSLSLTPSYGESESNLENLWEHGVSKAFATNRADYALRMNARLGFGLALPNAGLVLPYATARYGNSSQFGFGVNWKPKIRNLELDLLGEQFDTQQRILLKGSLGF